MIAYYPLTSTDQWTRDTHPSEGPGGPACTSTASIFDLGPSTTYLPIQIHLPGHEAKPNTFWPWIGTSPSEGDTTYKKRHRCHVYSYPDAKAGFAERNIDPDKNMLLHDEDRVSSRLAWSRTLGCLRRAFGVGANWPVVDIEAVWEEYWHRLLADLDRGKRRRDDDGGDDEGQMVRAEESSGSALEMMVARGQQHDGGFFGMMDLHEGDGPSVECVPTKAGGEFDSFSSSFRFDFFLLFSSIMLLEDKLITHRIKYSHLEILLSRHIHPQWSWQSTYPASFKDSWRRSNRRRNIVLLLPYCRSALATAWCVAHGPRYPGSHCRCG